MHGLRSPLKKDSICIIYHKKLYTFLNNAQRHIAPRNIVQERFYCVLWVCLGTIDTKRQYTTHTHTKLRRSHVPHNRLFANQQERCYLCLYANTTTTQWNERTNEPPGGKKTCMIAYYDASIHTKHRAEQSRSNSSSSKASFAPRRVHLVRTRSTCKHVI